ncbi:flagellar biosynthetic protein FliQ [Candidatus Laterigemmans baculatus]|uniref:flagellar biosynthetic protein FliQ n=1 Tax=Candidatus Laterigemmans baculatus TaxID=2770505 RepID=UPI0013D9FDEF|nr:flagellar biosynthetic protein FliQ [Candidatus Laterigemmans baculatus]
METSVAVDLVRETLIGAVIIGAPVLLVGMIAGLVIGLLQALTQVQDQTVSFVPKILAMAAALIACLPWLIERMLELTRLAFENAALVH